MPPTAPEPARRRFGPRIALVVIAVLLIILLLSARGLAVLFTDKLWFDDLGFGSTWTTLLWAKIEPALLFSGVMFAVMLVNLIVADKLGPKFRSTGPEDEIIDRYRTFIAPYEGRLRVGISVLFGVLVGVGASAQWKVWLLFENRVSFGQKDPQFHKDIGFYVFQLPFLHFLFQWLFVVFIVVLLVTGVFHYLNGGIRFQAPFQRVTPQVKAHLSVILALMAFTKTAQYWFGRYGLATSHRGVVEGPSYTDVHAQLPALQFLVLISIVGGVLFLVNIWRRGWTLPIIATGLWAFISIVLGTAYPAYVQHYVVKPNEGSKERTYIERNIAATRQAFGLNNVKVHNLDTDNLSANDLTNTDSRATLDNVRLWDPSVLADQVNLRQSFFSYYAFKTMAVDRYAIGSAPPTLELVSPRELGGTLNNNTWQNEHLVFTHGVGGVVVSGSHVTGNNGTFDPNYNLSDLPPSGDQSLKPNPSGVYFGTGLGGYAVVDTKTAEVEGGKNRSQSVAASHPETGVPVSSFLRKAAFAARFGDVNLLFSDRLTSDSRIQFVRDVRSRLQKAAPFLTFDSQPYLVILPDHSMDWVVDGYTTTDQYPYSQHARNNGNDPSGGLGTNVNYVRNSVKAVVNAYDGSVKLYVIDKQDPILRAWRKAFPHMFTDASKMPQGLAEHLRYPTDLFTVQTETYSLYHTTDPGQWYSGSDQWAVSPQPNTRVSGSFAATATQANGRVQSAGPRARPQYLMFHLPGDPTGSQSFVLTRAFVPASPSGGTDNQLSSFIAARSDGFDPNGGGSYGQLVVYQVSPTGSNEQVASPFLAANQIQADQTISSKLSLLDQHGSSVQLGTVQLLPLGNSIAYVQPVYVQAAGDSTFPRLTFLAAFSNDHAFLLSGASAAIAVGDTIGAKTSTGTQPTTTPTTTPSVGGSASALELAIKAAADQYQTDTKNGNYAKAGQDLQSLLALVAELPKTATSTTTPGSSTTTAPKSTTTASATTTTVAGG